MRPLALILALLLPAAALAQPAGFQKRPQTRASELDPFLWDAIRDAVEAAHAAEVDPKRGPENAREILERAKKQLGSTRLRTSLDLRMAAIGLRKHFIDSRRFPELVRRAQALSTYSRLDLGEPGLAAAIQEVLDARREAEKEVPKSLEIEAAVLARTRSFDKEAFEKKLREALDRAGVKLVLVKPEAADFVLKVGTRDVTSDGERRKITVSLDIEHIEGGEVEWRTASFRTSAADTAEAALDAGLDWLARIGGRDLLFRYLSDGPIPELAALTPGGHRH